MCPTRGVPKAYATVRDVRVLGCGCCGKPRSTKLSYVRSDMSPRSSERAFEEASMTERLASRL
eukprot:178153-Prymnesium_polylepis.1